MSTKRLAVQLRKCAEKCQARCCKYVTVKIDAPRYKCDIDEIRWFLAHESLAIVIESRLWYLQFDTRCKFLGESNLCSNYENRFDVCREYDVNNCEGTDGEPPIVFRTVEEFDAFIERRKQGRKRRAAAKSKRNSKKR